MQSRLTEKHAIRHLRVFGMAVLALSAMTLAAAAFLRLIAGGDEIFEREFPLIMLVVAALCFCLGTPLLSPARPPVARARLRTWSSVGAIAAVIAGILLISGLDIRVFETGALAAAVIGVPPTFKLSEFVASRTIAEYQRMAEAPAAKSAESS